MKRDNCERCRAVYLHFQWEEDNDLVFEVEQELDDSEERHERRASNFLGNICTTHVSYSGGGDRMACRRHSQPQSY